MILNAHAGTHYGIPFPVFCRAAFGTKGANVPALLRAQARLAARALATAWAGFRVRGNSNLLETYYHVIDAGQCDGFDPLGDWWNHTTYHGVRVRFLILVYSYI